MDRILLSLLLLSVSVQAKQVYFADAEGVRTSETVSPSLQLWRLRDFLFNAERIDPKQHALAVKTKDGFYFPNVEERLENFGESENGPARFYIVPIDPDTGEALELDRIKLASDCPKLVEKKCDCLVVPPSAPLATGTVPAPLSTITPGATPATVPATASTSTPVAKPATGPTTPAIAPGAPTKTVAAPAPATTLTTPVPTAQPVTPAPLPVAAPAKQPVAMVPLPRP